MRDGVTLQRRLSLAECKPRISPVFVNQETVKYASPACDKTILYEILSKPIAIIKPSEYFD